MDEGLASTQTEAGRIIIRLLLSAEPENSLERNWNWQSPSLDIEGTLRRRGHSYNGYPVSAGYFGSFSIDGLAVALHSVYHSRSFGETIETCVNHLGDADSTAAIAGQIAGAFYGWKKIESPFKEQMNRWDMGEIALRAAFLSLGPATTAENKDVEQSATSGTSETGVSADESDPLPGIDEDCECDAEAPASPRPLPALSGSSRGNAATDAVMVHLREYLSSNNLLTDKELETLQPSTLKVCAVCNQASGELVRLKECSLATSLCLHCLDSFSDNYNMHETHEELFKCLCCDTKIYDFEFIA